MQVSKNANPDPHPSPGALTNPKHKQEGAWQDSVNLISIAFTAKESTTSVLEHCMRHKVGELNFLFSS